MSNILDEKIQGQVREVFAKMKEPVRLLFFGSENNCEYCAEVRQLLEELTGASEKLDLQVFDLEKDTAVAQLHRVSNAPGIVVAALNGAEVVDYGIQYSGIPSGHEFSTLVNDILLVSGRDSGLSQETREYLKNLEQPLELQVFVTPTCPHCPRAVLLAHQMAMENPAMVRAEGIEATEFPELSERFQVRGVPQTVINAGKGIVVGAYPERNLLAEIMRAVN